MFIVSGFWIGDSLSHLLVEYSVIGNVLLFRSLGAMGHGAGCYLVILGVVESCTCIVRSLMIMDWSSL